MGRVSRTYTVKCRYRGSFIPVHIHIGSSRGSGSRIKIPGGRENRQRNGHKAQLDLKRQIQCLEGKLEEAQRQASKAADRQAQLENHILSVERDRASLRAGLDALESVLQGLELALGMKPGRLSGEKRSARLQAAVARLRGARPSQEQATGAPALA